MEDRTANPKRVLSEDFSYRRSVIGPRSDYLDYLVRIRLVRSVEELKYHFFEEIQMSSFRKTFNDTFSKNSKYHFFEEFKIYSFRKASNVTLSKTFKCHPFEEFKCHCFEELKMSSFRRISMNFGNLPRKVNEP